MEVPKVTWYKCMVCGIHLPNEPSLALHLFKKHAINILSLPKVTLTPTRIIIPPSSKLWEKFVPHEVNVKLKLNPSRKEISEDDESEEELEQDDHNAQNDSDENSCPVCKFSARNSWTLFSHMTNSHPEERRYSCNDCGSESLTQQDLLDHIRLHCEKSGEEEPVVKAEQDLDFPKTQKDKPKRSYEIKCSFKECPATFPTTQKTESHQATHGTEFNCKFCPVGFRNRKGLSIHLQKFHAEKFLAIMTVDQRRLNLTVDVDEHLNTNWSCPHCPKTFDGKEKERFISHLQGHNITLAPSSQDKDSIDNHLLPKKSTHSAQHSEDDVGNDVTCPVCKLRLITANALENHLIALHSGAKGFFCPACGEGFKKRWGRNLHVIRSCRKARESGLQEQERRKMERDLFKCDVHGCEEIFYESNQFKRHNLSHGTEKMCRFCPVGYKHTRGLSAHLKKFHLNNRTEETQESTEPEPQPALTEKTEVQNNNFIPALISSNYYCPNCPKIFSQKEKTRFISHLEWHKSHPFRCDICGSMYRLQTSLDEHICLKLHEPQSNSNPEIKDEQLGIISDVRSLALPQPCTSTSPIPQEPLDNNEDDQIQTPPPSPSSKESQTLICPLCKLEFRKSKLEEHLLQHKPSYQKRKNKNSLEGEKHQKPKDALLNLNQLLFNNSNSKPSILRNTQNESLQIIFDYDKDEPPPPLPPEEDPLDISEYFAIPKAKMKSKPSLPPPVYSCDCGKRYSNPTGLATHQQWNCTLNRSKRPSKQQRRLHICNYCKKGFSTLLYVVTHERKYCKMKPKSTIIPHYQFITGNYGERIFSADQQKTCMNRNVEFVEDEKPLICIVDEELEMEETCEY